MKTIDEIMIRILELKDIPFPLNQLGFNKLRDQVLDWAKGKIQNNPLNAESIIRQRLEDLEDKQLDQEPLAFAVKPARNSQIEELKWVLDV